MAAIAARISPITAGSSGGAGNPQSIFDVIPGLTGLTNKAASNIGNNLNGLPSASWARTQNAYNGVSSGQPATGGDGTFQENRGQDLYHQQAQQQQQQGLQDLLSLIGGTSGTLTATPGQILQNNQFNKQLGQNASQFDQQNSLNQMNTLLQSLGIMNQF